MDRFPGAEPGWGFTGLELRGQRLHAGLSQAELASLMGVTQGTVSKWEDDALVPSSDQLEALAVAFDRADWELEAALVASMEVPADRCRCGGTSAVINSRQVRGNRRRRRRCLDCGDRWSTEEQRVD